MRAYIYYVSPFLPFFLTLKKDALQPLSQSAGYGKVSYFLQKSFLYILAVSIKALLLHPLSGTKAAMVWHSDRKRCRNPIIFLFPATVLYRKACLEKEKRKKTSKTFGAYHLKFLPLHPLLKRKQRQVDILTKKRRQGPFSLKSPSFRQESGRAAFGRDRKKENEKKLQKHLERIWKSPYLCIRFPKRGNDQEEAIFEEIYINNTSSTRARTPAFGREFLGIEKRTVNTYIYR